MKKIDLNKISKDVLDNYTNSVGYVQECINENFEIIIDYISKIKGRVIITGIGKSAIIGMKISATLNSTGTPSIFLHGSDALHGDIGVATKNNDGSFRSSIAILEDYAKVYQGLSDTQKAYTSEQIAGVFQIQNLQ